MTCRARRSTKGRKQPDHDVEVRGDPGSWDHISEREGGNTEESIIQRINVEKKRKKSRKKKEGLGRLEVMGQK